MTGRFRSKISVNPFRKYLSILFSGENQMDYACRYVLNNSLDPSSILGISTLRSFLSEKSFVWHRHTYYSMRYMDRNEVCPTQPFTPRSFNEVGWRRGAYSIYSIQSFVWHSHLYKPIRFFVRKEGCPAKPLNKGDVGPTLKSCITFIFFN